MLKGSLGSVCPRDPIRSCRLRVRRLEHVSSGVCLRLHAHTDRQRVVVMRGELGLCIDRIGGRRSMVLCRIWSACRVEGTRSRLQCSAIAGSSLGLNCAWSHDCCRVVDRG
jgi:hypothetical protein